MEEDNEVSVQADSYTVDLRTGEICDDWEEVEPTYLEAINTDNIHSFDDYLDVVRDRMKGKRYRLFISPLLLDMVIEKSIGIPALCVFCMLGQKVGYGNMVYTTTREICQVTGYSRQTVSGVIQELLSHRLLKEVGKKLKGRDDRFFLISPLYFFLGYHPHRDALIKGWFMG